MLIEKRGTRNTLSNKDELMNSTLKEKKKIRTAFVVIFALFGALLLIGTLYAQKFVEQELLAYLNRSTKGRYKISFAHIRVNLFNHSVSLTDVEVSGAPLADKSYYIIRTKELEIGNIAAKKLFQKRRLSMDLLFLKNPNIAIYSAVPIEDDSIKQSMFDVDELLLQLKPFFTSTLHEIHINHFKIDQANVSYYNTNNPDKLLNSIKKLDVTIDGFRVNMAILDSHNLFNSDNVTLRVSDLNYGLKDGNHKLHLSRLTYLLSDNSFFGENLSIIPSDTLVDHVPLYWVSLPHFSLRTNINKLTQVDSIIVDTLTVLDADIRYRPVSDKKFDFTQIDKLNLYNLIKGDFKKIAINQLQLDAKKFILEPADETKQPQVFKKVQFQASKFEVDSTAGLNLNKFLYTDNFKLTVDEYSHLLNNRAQRVEANQVQIDTYDKHLSARNISLVQIDTISLATNYNFTCDSIALSGISLPRLLHDQKLPVNQLTIYQPKVEIERIKDRNTVNHVNNFQKQVYKFVNNYVEGIYAKGILIKDGSIEFFDNRNNRLGYIGTGFQFELDGFKLDASSLEQSNRLFGADRFDILLNNYSMDMDDHIHQLDIDTVHLSSHRECLDISNAHLHAQTKNNLKQIMHNHQKYDLFNIRLPEIHLTHTNMLEAFFHQRLIIDKFDVNHAYIGIESFGGKERNKVEKKIDLEEFYQIVRSYVDYVQIKELNFHQAKLFYVNHNKKGEQSNFNNQFSLTLNQFLLDEQSAKHAHKLPAKAFRLSIENHTFHLADGVHSIYADAVKFTSEDSSLRAVNVELFADSLNKNYGKLPWIYKVTAPEISLTGIDLNIFTFNKRLEAGVLSLNDAQVQLYENFEQNKARRKNKAQYSPFHFMMPKGINAFSLHEFNFKQGHLSIVKKIKGNNHSLLTTHINALFHAIQINEDKNRRANTSVGKYEFSLNDLRFTPLNKQQEFTFRKFQVSSANNQSELLDFNFSQQDDTGEKYPLVHLPRLTMNNIDPVMWIDYKRLKSSSIILENPEIDLTKRIIKTTTGHNKEEKNSTLARLPEELKPIVNLIESDELRIKDAQVSFPEYMQLKKMEHINMTLNNVHIDTTLSTKLFGAENFSLTSKNISFSDSKKLYNFSLDSIGISSKSKNLILQGIKFIPLYDPNSYQSYFDFQNDYFLMRSNTVELQNLDIRRLIDDKSVYARRLIIDKLGLYAYRDKRLPFDMANHPPMPQELIKSLPININIDTVELKNSTFAYSEQLTIAPEAFKVCFDKTNALIYPFSNINHTLQQHKTMEVDVNSKLQGMGNINANINFNMLADSCNYSLRADLLPFELNSISEITDNAALVSIESGQLNRLHVNFDADKFESNGTIRLNYDDLSITALKYKNDKIKQRRFLSFMANTFVPSKTKKNGKRTQGTIHFERDDNKSIFNYWWKSVLSGLVDSFGLGNNKK